MSVLTEKPPGGDTRRGRPGSAESSVSSTFTDMSGGKRTRRRKSRRKENLNIDDSKFKQGWVCGDLSSNLFYFSYVYLLLCNGFWPKD